jgi:hypothetical protein
MGIGSCSGLAPELPLHFTERRYALSRPERMALIALTLFVQRPMLTAF